MQLDSGLLTSYMETFIGFGSLEAPYWFVGMEQGGGESIDELGRRLDAWRALGSAPVLDLRDYCELLGETRWHGPRARIQPTLGKMIRVVLAARSEDPSPHAVRSYQDELFGRCGGETLVAELMPLPSRSVDDWIYREVSTLPHLQTRAAYLAVLGPIRQALLRGCIDRYRPKGVVFMGWSYADAWTAVIEQPLRRVSEPGPGLLIGTRGAVTCIVCHHPTSFGITNQYFAAVGALVG